jgi:hypothetical protein
MAGTRQHQRQRGMLAHFLGRRCRSPRTLTAAAALLALAVAGAMPAAAQIVPTPDPGRDCQTVRTCNFSRGAAVRGCLSSYTCRICRTVRSRCSIGNRRQVCERIVCSWGG